MGIREKLRLLKLLIEELKLLIEEAAYNSTINTTFNRSLSIIQAHQAIEWIFRLILLEKRPEVERALDSPFPRLLSMVKGIPSAKGIVDRYSALIQKLKDTTSYIIGP